MVQGKCLCGKICFELSGKLPNLYQCHCSLCRRLTGSSANAAFTIGLAQFRWLAGEELVREFELASGYKSHFCANCGSPLPNLTANDSAWWVPVGLLEDTHGLRVGAHVYVDSRAGWDVIPQSGERFGEMPDAETMRALLRHDNDSQGN